MAVTMMTNGLMTTYGRLPVTFTHGEGIWLFDSEGRRHFDGLTGIAVCGLGHCHPAVTRAIQEQAARLVHTSNLYHVAAQEALGSRLAAIAGMDACFFSNSGAEANECAIKLARYYGHQKGIDVPTIIVAEKAFHGRTMATLTATGSKKVQMGFEPLVEGFLRVPFDNVAAVRDAVASNPSVVAVMVEPVQGEGGIHVPADDYLASLRDICDQHGLLLITDEIQTGNGRTGTYFAYQQSGILPDVVTTAKGLGNGFPIGACLARGHAASLFKPGNHGSTYGGNPLGCATALAVVDTIMNDGLCERAAHLGELIRNAFRERLAGNAILKEVRGKGLMIGVELTDACGELPKMGIEDGILLNVTADSVIRLLPAFIMSDAEALELVDRVTALIHRWLAARQAAAPQA
jgi:acetylornithine aminotransferase